MKMHDALIGRWRRHVRWAVLENVIFIDWREIRSGFSRGHMPEIHQ